MANSDVDVGAASDLSAGGRRLSDWSEGCGVGAAGGSDPKASPGGRPRKPDIWAAMHVILYLLRIGCSLALSAALDEMQDDDGPQTWAVSLPTLKRRCRFGQGTFAGASGNDEDPPKAAA